VRAIIIDDKDAIALVEQLKLDELLLKDNWPGVREFELFKEGKISADQFREALVKDIHRTFHFHVVRWLQDQGANVTR
jgi:hypothetical protein